MLEATVIATFAAKELCDRTGPIKSRVMTAIALVERLRDDRVLSLKHHIGNVRNGFQSQNTYARQAITRLELKGDFGEYGRRSNDLDVWGPLLISLIKSAECDPSIDDDWLALMGELHGHFTELWQKLYSFDPLRPNFGLGSAAAVIADLIAQADVKGTSASFAQSIVGAKLEVRLGIKLDAAPVNSPDRSPRDRAEDKPADFVVNDAAIEVTLGEPDESHLAKAERIVRHWKKEAWLLVRARYVGAWTAKIVARLGQDSAMVVVLSIEGFVGQNMAERGGFSRPFTQDELRKLFVNYNDRWTASAYSPLIVL